MSSNYTIAEKRREIERELAMRLRHYPAMIEKGTLSYSVAMEQMSILRDIIADYRVWENARNVVASSGSRQTVVAK